MTLEEFNFIAEIIASIAVIASLIYVALQIKQNTAATHATAAQSFAEADNGFVGLINTSNNLADILHRGAMGLSELKGGELIQFMAFNDAAFMAMHSAYCQWDKGTLDDRLWSSFKHAILGMLSQPGQQEWWQHRRHWYDENFRNYIEAAAETESVKPMHPGAVAG
jgi:hypothetical protein